MSLISKKRRRWDRKQWIKNTDSDVAYKDWKKNNPSDRELNPYGVVVPVEVSDNKRKSATVRKIERKTREGR